MSTDDISGSLPQCDMETPVISTGDKVRGAVTITGVLLTFTLEGNTKFQLEVSEHKVVFLPTRVHRPQPKDPGLRALTALIFPSEGLGFPWPWFLHLQRGLGRWAELALKAALWLGCALGIWLGLAKPHWLQKGAPGSSTLRLIRDGMRSCRQSVQQRSSGRGSNPRMNLVLWWPTQAAQWQMRGPCFPH